MAPNSTMISSKKSENHHVKIAPGSAVCAECDLQGDITIGSRTVIHPKAQIIAEAGPIIIGENNLIEEQAQIINRLPSNAPANTQFIMIIGNNNVFEVDSRCEALKVGDNNVLEIKAKVGRNVELTYGCIVGAMCELTAYEVVPENTVVFGSECQRRVQQERPPPQTLQIDFLTKVLPNYHYLKKSKKSAH